MNSASLALAVKAVVTPHELIRCFTLGTDDDRVLPAFTAGAHIPIQILLPNGATDWRHYSLVSYDLATCSIATPTTYRIAVRLEAHGNGGSRFMHQLRVGDVLTVGSPRNHFSVGEHRDTSVLIAGGIGVTPLISMAAWRKHLGLPVRMIYAARSHSQMVFVEELQALLGSDLRLHSDLDAGGSLDVPSVLARCDSADVLYICGPRPLLEAILLATKNLGWPRERVRFEAFDAPAARIDDHDFEVVLRRSGETVHVPVNRSILECLEEHGSDVVADCRRGECGVCAVEVLEGEIDHRDSVLSDSEKSKGKVIQTCVSRAMGSRIVLDI